MNVKDVGSDCGLTRFVWYFFMIQITSWINTSLTYYWYPMSIFALVSRCPSFKAAQPPSLFLLAHWLEYRRETIVSCLVRIKVIVSRLETIQLIAFYNCLSQKMKIIIIITLAFFTIFDRQSTVLSECVYSLWIFILLSSEDGWVRVPRVIKLIISSSIPSPGEGSRGAAKEEVCFLVCITEFMCY